MLINERYTDFLKFALHRIIEIALFYESEAKICKNPSNKLFLYFLAGKKRVQHVVLEMIATSSRRGKPLQLPDYSSFNLSDIREDTCLSTANAEEILKFAHSRAEKDLNLYLSLAALEEDAQTKKLLTTLGRLSKDFMQDVTAGFAKFIFNRSVKEQPKQTVPIVPTENRFEKVLSK